MRTIQVSLAVKDEELRGRMAEAVKRDESFVLQNAGSPVEGSLLVFQPGEEPLQDLDRLARVIGRGVVRDAFFLAPSRDADLLVEAARAGVREILLPPFGEEEVASALRRYASRTGQDSLPHASPGGGGRLAVVASAKPGCGATTTAVNLALAAAKAARGARVVLADFARPRPEISLHLDLEHQYDWSEAVGDSDRLDTSFVDGLLAEHESGVALLACPKDVDKQDLGAEQASLLAQRLTETADLVIADLGSDLDEASIALLERADNAYLMLDGGLASLAAAKEVVDALRTAEASFEEGVKLVATRCSKSAISKADAQELLGKSIHHRLPADHERCLASLNQGRPLLLSSPGCPLSKAYKSMAKEFGLKAVSRSRGGSPGLPRWLGGSRNPVPA
ncbi:AAA family ATPase [Desulfohalovibrio reitneri]|uniref:AAA family ATPase n=1 Tax=Desulfohalovibrio reitneri TaxID=1307759 RepID=UPI0004A6E625|nr:hypothetical protein [Desulfohalovibrio reitneri]